SKTDSKTGGQQHISVDTYGHSIGLWSGRWTLVDAKKEEMPMERVCIANLLAFFSVLLTLNECSHCSPQYASASRTFSGLSYDLS
ncbi:MAG TPA: hypothetical protein DCK85_11265, partial [Ktedonobacter sp.]|nr:hypothetical protein [Ktedonobacter sp.]